MTDVPTTLRPSEDRTWLLLVGLMMWLPAELDARLASMAKVSHVEFLVLRWLTHSKDRAIHMSGLATAISVTPSHLTRIVSRLEKRSLVTRTPDPDDGRFTLVRLAADGAQLVTRNELAYVRTVRELLFDRLEKDQVQDLDEITARVLAHLKPECVAAVS
jgi:DNA-binding MarR family transcriptional regulator